MSRKIETLTPGYTTEQAAASESQAGRRNPTDNLPSEVQADILQHLPAKSILSLAATNRQTRHEIQHTSTLYERFKQFHGNGPLTPQIPRNLQDAWKVFVAHEKSVDLFRLHIQDKQGTLHNFAPDTVRQLDVSSDGRFRIACATTHELMLWDPHDVRSPLKTLLRCDAQWDLVQFSKSGRHLVATTAQGSVYLWDLSQQKLEPRVWQAHTAQISTADMSQNSAQLLTAAVDNTLKVWNLSAKPFATHTLDLPEPLFQAFFHDNDRRIITLNQQGILQTWNIDSSAPKAHTVAKVSSENFVGAVVSEDLRYLVTGDDSGNITLQDSHAETSSAISFAAHTDSINDLRFSKDGQSIISASDDETVKICRLEDFPNAYQSLMGHQQPVMSATLSVDGHYALSTSEDQNLNVWDVRPLTSISAPIFPGFQNNTLSRAEVTDDNRFVVIRSLEQGQIAVIDRLTSQSTHLDLNLVNAEARTHTFSLSKSNNLLGTTFSNTIHLWDLEDLSKPTHVLEQQPGRILRSYFAPTNRYFITVSDQHAVTVWDTKDLTSPKRTFQNMIYATDVSFSADGKFTAFWSGSPSRINIVNLETMHLLSLPLTEQEAQCRNTFFSPDGRYLVVSDQESKYTSLWDMQSSFPEKIHTFAKDTEIRCIQFSTDTSLYAASLKKDDSIRLYDKNHQLRESIDHNNESEQITRLMFSQNNRFLTAVLSSDRMLVWDLNAKTRSYIDVCYHDEYVDHAQFSGNQTTLISSDSEGDISIRNLDHYPNIYAYTASTHITDINQILYIEQENTVLIFSRSGVSQSLQVSDKDIDKKVP